MSGSRSGARRCVWVLLLAGLFASRIASAWIVLVDQDFAKTVGLDRWEYSGATLGGQDLFRVDGGELKATWDAGAGLNRPDIVTSHFSASLGLPLTSADTFRVRAVLRVDAIYGRDFYQIANFGLFNPTAMGHNRTFVDGGGDTPRNLAEFNYWITPLGHEGFGNPQIGPVVISDDEIWAAAGFASQLGENLLPFGEWMYVELFYDAVTRMGRTSIYTDPGYSALLLVGGVPMEETTAGPLLETADFSLTHVGFFNYVAAYEWGFGEPMHGVGGEGAVQRVTAEVIPEPGVGSLLLLGLAVAALRARRAWRSA